MNELIPNINDVKTEFKRKLANKDFVIDKSGVKTVELLGLTFLADEETIFGVLNSKYAKKELDWYNSPSLNVYDMPKAPTIWRQVCDKDGYIHSNYGWIIYSKDNHEQYTHCLRTLRKDKDSRRAMMVYTRPAIQREYNQNQMSDFICTNTVHALIRDDKLHYVVNQRSCDAIFGFKNDVYWHRHVHQELFKDLCLDYKNLTLGDIKYQVGSLHVYEQHFNLIGDAV